MEAPSQFSRGIKAILKVLKGSMSKSVFRKNFSRVAGHVTRLKIVMNVCTIFSYSRISALCKNQKINQWIELLQKLKENSSCKL